MVDGVVLAHQLERGLVVKVSPLATYLLMRLRQQHDRSSMTALRLRLLPFLRRLTRRCAIFSARSALRYQPGEKICVPSDRGANASIPRSIPVCCPVAGSGCTGTSAQEKQTYHPS